MEKDSLYSLFNKKFRSPSKRDMDWVSPDDAIFENVLSDIIDEDRKKPVFWRNRYGFLLLLLIPIAGLFAVYGVSIAEETRVMPDVSQAVPLMSSTAEVASVKEITKQNSFTEDDNLLSLQKNNTIAELDNTQSSLINRLNTNTNTSSRLFNNNVSLTRQGGLGVAESVSTESGVTEELNNPELLHSSESINNMVVGEQTQGLHFLSALDNRVDFSQFNVELKETQLPELAELTEVKLTQELGRTFSIAAGYLSSSVSHPNGPLSNDMVMNGHDEYQSGWNIEAAYNQEIGSRWTLHTSLGFNRIQMESLTTCSFNYDSANESMNQGQLMYNTPLTLITPTTGFVDNVEFVIEEGAMNDDDMLMNNLDISQGISTLSVGLGISNEIFAKNKFSLTLGANVGLDYIVRIQERMKVELMTEDYMLFEKDKEWVNHHGLNRFGASAGVNISGQWKLSDTHSIFIRPSYRRSLTSIRSGDILTERSFFNIYNISTGVNIRF